MAFASVTRLNLRHVVGGLLRVDEVLKD